MAQRDGLSEESRPGAYRGGRGSVRAYAAYGLDGAESSSKPCVRRMLKASFEPCGGEQNKMPAKQA